MKLLVLGVLFVATSSSYARTLREMQRGHFVGDGSNDVAVTVLQSLNEKKQNAVFSPLGYNTVLAVLTEGARGNTRNQLVSSLKLPEDTYAVRSTYKRVLSEMTEGQVLNKPQFKNWFYVYKNYTVEQSYKNILKDNYLIDVKEVNRYDYDDEEDGTSVKPLDAEGSTEAQAAVNTLADIGENSGSSEEKDPKEEKDSKEDKDSKEEKDSKENKDSKEDKDSKESNESKEDDSKESEKPKASKKPTNVMKIKEKDDTLKKEKPVFEGVMTLESGSPASPEDSQKVSEVENDSVGIETTVRVDDATTQPPSDMKPNSDIAEATIDVRRSERDTATVLSANNLSSTLKSESDEERVSQNLRKLSRMMAFNALYFKGNWSTRFTLSPEKKAFHVSPKEEKMVEVLHAEDEFEVGKVAELDAWALDLPYQGERYSLLVLVPASDDGLDGLLKRLPGFSFYNIDKQLTKLRTRVCIPKLKFYSITKPKDSFIKSGITDLFNEEADLSGISGEKGLYLDDLVQLVTFEIGETQSSYNYLTTTDVTDLRATPMPFSADKPFIFILRDKVENLNIVSGIVYDPEQPQEW